MSWFKNLFKRTKTKYDWKIPVIQVNGREYPLQGISFDANKTMIILRNLYEEKNAIEFYSTWVGRKVVLFEREFKVSSATGSAYGLMEANKVFMLNCNKE